MLRDYQERIGRQLSLTVQIRLDKANDPELLAAMREAGVRHVAIGFESPIDEELKAMNKHISSEKMLSLVKVFRRFGFWVHGMFIFGYPVGPGTQFTMPAQRAGEAIPAVHPQDRHRQRAGPAARCRCPERSCAGGSKSKAESIRWRTSAGSTMTAISPCSSRMRR